MPHRSKEIASDTAKFVLYTSKKATVLSLRTARAIAGGTYAPIIYLIDVEKGARGFREKTMAALPVLAPVLPALGVVGFTYDLNLAALTAAGGLYLEGAGISFVLEFLCPPDERNFREKLGPFSRLSCIRGVSKLRLHR